MIGVDRTTMVSLIDDLQRKGLVLRCQDPEDRRKNVVVMTDAGKATLRDAARAGGETERVFLEPLSDGEAEQFKRALRALLFGSGSG
jgi:DNA-binding MarR family transcriptional regulator